MKQGHDLLTTAQVAEMYGPTDLTIRRWIRLALFRYLVRSRGNQPLSRFQRGSIGIHCS